MGFVNISLLALQQQFSVPLLWVSSVANKVGQLSTIFRQFNKKKEHFSDFTHFQFTCHGERYLNCENSEELSKNGKK